MNYYDLYLIQSRPIRTDLKIREARFPALKPINTHRQELLKRYASLCRRSAARLAILFVQTIMSLKFLEHSIAANPMTTTNHSVQLSSQSNVDNEVVQQKWTRSRFKSTIRKSAVKRSILKSKAAHKEDLKLASKTVVESANAKEETFKRNLVAIKIMKKTKREKELIRSILKI